MSGLAATDTDTRRLRDGADACRPAGVVQGFDARIRVVIAAAFAVMVVALNDLRLLVVALALALLLAALARLPPALTLKRMLGVDAFMLPILMLLPFTVAGGAIGSLAGWPISAEGIRQAAMIVVTANAVVLAVLALVGTIEPARLGGVLRALGMPAKIVHLLALMTRYVALFEGEYARLRLAMKARAFRPRGNLHTWRSLGYLFGMLLVHSFERGERIADAMKCRGFAGRFAPAERPPLAAADWAFAGFAGLTLSGLAAAELLA
jgi:cobalt/nickel transport system permease protein